MVSKKDLEELIQAGVISEEVAGSISDYYHKKDSNAGNRFIVIFSIVGATLIGGGIVLIIASNWDQLSQITKTILAFVPLILGQLLMVFVLLRKNENQTWRESSGVFQMLTIGATISLVSQVYYIPGRLDLFMLMWTALSLPIIYLMRSSVASLLYLIGIMFYAIFTDSEIYLPYGFFYFLVLFLAGLPHYIHLIRTKSESVLTTIHHWIIPFVLVVASISIGDQNDSLMFLVFISLFCLYELIGKLHYFDNLHPKKNTFLFIGSIGIIISLLVVSYKDYWQKQLEKGIDLSETLLIPEILAIAVFGLLACYLTYRQIVKKTFHSLSPTQPAYVIAIFIFLIGLQSSLAVILINVYIFIIGLLIIIKGMKTDHLGKLNYGLVIITFLVIFRVFDTNLSFALRGLLFLIVGVGFFITNFQLLKKRKAHEK
jgi:uncharacterized membrane protein